MDRYPCIGFHGMPCIKKNCWCGGEIYAHGFAEDCGYCKECLKRIESFNNAKNAKNGADIGKSCNR